jgi:hypothetical protein
MVPIMSIASPNETTRDRTAMIHRAFWLEYITLAWMTVEAAVAIASGIAANCLTLVAFGIDSVIELASAGVLVWRLTVELRRRKIRQLLGAKQTWPGHHGMSAFGCWLNRSQSVCGGPSSSLSLAVSIAMRIY